ncbi:MAG: MBL fold metallo-hydrolase [Alphaproteobacteria bacterium]|nr:MBL fold metallo-hydrolase [Alphaproteobacteria bacterium]
MNRRAVIARSATAAAALLFSTGAYRYNTNSSYSGPMSDHFDGTRFFVPGHPLEGGIARLLRWRFGETAASWSAFAPSPFADVPPQRVGGTGLRVALIGHASLLYQVAGLNILVDPVYSERASPVSIAGPKRVNPPGIAFDALPPIDLVVVSHGHYDHLDTATLGQIAGRWKPTVIAPLGNDAAIAPAIASASAVQTYDWGQAHDAGNGVTVHFTPSYHWSARGLLDRRKALWASFVITTPAGTIYHVADTGYGDGRFFRDAGKTFGPIRLATLPIGAYEPRWFMQPQHVNPAEAVKIMTDCGAASAIGHHWGTFQLTNEAIDQPERDLSTARAAAGLADRRFAAFRPGQVWAGETAA